MVTKKGKGYDHAEADPGKFHGVEPFALKTGEILKKTEGITYTKAFKEAMLELGAKKDKLVAITAAMPSGTGLSAFAKKYPERFFDVGIAEEHAVTFAAGMAASGYHPVVAVYSTFLQRAYDQILHDVCIGNLPVTFAIDRAGIVGKDGETHQGVFDLSYLSHIPNLTVMAPKNTKELRKMLSFAVDCDFPVAIRYPRGTAGEAEDIGVEEIRYGKAETLAEGHDVAIVSVGSTADEAASLRAALSERDIYAGIVNARFVAPMDEETILTLARTHKVLVTLEENVARGGFGERVAALLKENAIETPLVTGALDNCFIEHGDATVLKNAYGLNMEAIIEKIMERYGH